MTNIFANLLLIIIGLTISLIPFKVLRFQIPEKRAKILIFVTGSLLIVTSMCLSVSMNNTYLFDLRIIPFMLGSLYGGPTVSIALLLIMLSFRALIGINIGLFASIINYTPLAVLFALYSRKFLSSRFQTKMLIAMFCFAVYLFLNIFIFNNMINGNNDYATIYWETFFLKIATIVLFIIFINMIDQYNRVQIKLDDMGKMELMYHLSASISHEVRNGLTSTHGFLQLLHEEETDPLKKQYLRIALDELIRTESIIRDFLSFGKPNEKEFKTLELQTILENCLILIEPLANMHSIVIQKNIQPAFIKGDEGMLQQAVLNISKNAIEAMPNGGCLNVQLTADHEKAILQITDSGVGMSQEQIARLGTPYFSTKGKKGTGLGLMVAFRVIEQLNGSVHITSEEGKGTTFTITLPITAQ